MLPSANVASRDVAILGVDCVHHVVHPHQNRVDAQTAKKLGGPLWIHNWGLKSLVNITVSSSFTCTLNDIRKQKFTDIGCNMANKAKPRTYFPRQLAGALQATFAFCGSPDRASSTFQSAQPFQGLAFGLPICTIPLNVSTPCWALWGDSDAAL